MNQFKARRTSAIRSGLFGLFLVMASAAGCQTQKGPLDVPLMFRPTDTQTVGASDMNASLYVAPVTDDRDVKDEIGQNTEGATPIKVSTNDNPAVFMRGAVIDQLRKAGVKVVDQAEAADRTLAITLTRFFVEESSTYKTTVRSTVQLIDRSGTVAWNGTVIGENSKWGRSLSRENYQEALSDATLNMVTHLLSNEGFQKAMKK